MTMRITHPKLCAVMTIFSAWMIFLINGQSKFLQRNNHRDLGGNVDEAGGNQTVVRAYRQNVSVEAQEGRVIRFTVGNLNGEEGRVGEFLIRTYPSWAPAGAERVDVLVASSFWTSCRFFRVIPNFVAQFGINGDPNVQKEWNKRKIADEQATHANTRGTISFASAGANTRSTQLFINLKDNDHLDNLNFPPVAEVLEDGMSIVDQIYSGYEGNPLQGMIQKEGNAYLQKEFPELTFISKAEFVENGLDIQSNIIQSTKPSLMQSKAPISEPYSIPSSQPSLDSSTQAKFTLIAFRSIIIGTIISSLLCL